MEQNTETHVESLEVAPPLDAKQTCLNMGMQWHELVPEVDVSVVELIDPELAVRLRVLPIAIQNERLQVAMLSPTDI